MTNELTNANIDEALKSDKVIVIDFWADFCCQCKAFKPTFESLSEDEDLKDVEFYTCDGEENDDIAAKFSIRGLPTVIIIKQGTVVDRFNGLGEKNSLKEKIQAVINK